MTAGQWEKYIEQAAEAIKGSIWQTRRYSVDENDCEVPDGSPEAVGTDCMTFTSPVAAARAALAVVAPLIAEDARDRMVAAAAEILKREAPNRLAVSEYTVYPAGYHETETPSDKHHFVITVKDRGKGWAVCWMGDCLNRNGEWEHESIPSSRTDAFLARCRFSEDEARLRAIEAVDKLTINGRTFVEAVQWVRERS